MSDLTPPSKVTKKQKKEMKAEERRLERVNAAKAVEAAKKAEIDARIAAGAVREIDGVELPDDLIGYVERLDENRVLIKRGLAKDMNVDGIVFANKDLLPQLIEEARANCSEKGSSFVYSLRQVANVASVPGIVGHSLAMPDAHSGYGFSIGGVAAMDMDAPGACICPGGVGYDINCGVCLLRTDLDVRSLEKANAREALAEALYRRVPVGVGSGGGVTVGKELDNIMQEGLGWLVRQGLAWPEDVQHCESGGVIEGADPKLVSQRAKGRGISQCGTLGSGNHYIEVQAVDEVYDAEAAERMGLNCVGRVCVMVHSGSRGLGHQICSDALRDMQRAEGHVANPNDPQLTGVPVASQAGQDYLHAMACGANFAFCNRGAMRLRVREAFEEVFGASARDLGMTLVYDVCHNFAKVEDHVVDGTPRRLVVHRKGATRAFPPGHPDLPEDYRDIGQPVIIGGSMGTCSYVLTGTQHGMETTFGSTCHGAGRCLSRSAAIRSISSKTVFDDLAEKGIILKIASPELVAEEASGAYKDVSSVVKTCHDAGISKLVVRLTPLIVIKG